FLEQKLKLKPGPVVDTKGRSLGKHQGLAFYTIGQRQGIGIGGGDGPFYVVRKVLAANTLVVTNDPNDKALLTREIEIHSVNWITEPRKFPAKIKGRYRHQGDLQALTISKAKIGR